MVNIVPRDTPAVPAVPAIPGAPGVTATPALHAVAPGSRTNLRISYRNMLNAAFGLPLVGVPPLRWRHQVDTIAFTLIGENFGYGKKESSYRRTDERNGTSYKRSSP